MSSMNEPIYKIEAGGAARHPNDTNAGPCTTL